MDSLDLTTSAQTLYEGKTGTSQSVTLSKFMLLRMPPAPILKYKHITGRAMILLFCTSVPMAKGSTVTWYFKETGLLHLNNLPFFKNVLVRFLP